MMLISSEIKDYFSIMAASIAASLAIVNWRANRFRGKLKDDLEIMKRYREELQAVGKTPCEVERDDHYKVLLAKIHRKMIKAYVLRGTDWSDALVSLLFLFLAIYATKNPRYLAIEHQSATIAALVVAAAIFLIKAVWDKNQPRQ